MPKYMFHGSYTAEGVKGVLKEGGSARRKAVEDAVKSVGGRVECFYFVFGDADVVVIADLPDNVTAATFAVGVAGTGTVSTKTYPLLTPEELDEATKKVMNFRAAGR